jgi:hypothetical protein
MDVSWFADFWAAVSRPLRPLFQAWMHVAEGLQRVVTATIFGACYLVLAPLFAVVTWVRDPLHLRRRSTSWVSRRAEIDAASLERMG